MPTNLQKYLNVLQIYLARGKGHIGCKLHLQWVFYNLKSIFFSFKLIIYYKYD